VTETKKVKVLAVDDSKTMLAMISAQLKGSDFEVVATASSGPEALEKYKQHKPHLVLLDIVMPEVTVDAVQDCLKKGAKSFLQKPLQREGMLTQLKSVCEESGVTP
jgi:DNA-binding NtrC family response regulator